MIYLIFTASGFEQARTIIIDNSAQLWINEGVLTPQQINELGQHDVVITVLAKLVSPSDEKSIMQVIDRIEQQHPDAEILVEFI